MYLVNHVPNAYTCIHFINFCTIYKLYMSITDLEAIKQYEKMLSIEEALMGAEPDVNVEEITGVSCLSAYTCMYIAMAHMYVHT